ncbi:MAG: hypothetical protein Q8R81_09435 [Novosphingobium sp.]|uniref:hypothetical protein n=1 Tax=Novosphingobium sp. TaxID=1874826 RepID=UPI00273707F0|nr:hypothetical protein [Novosphingobium sp.]MDP3550606.1 hypothetical protein [Novosphingobium sp.]
MSEMIGRLRVALGLETAAFEKGAKRASAEIDAFGSKAEKAGFAVGRAVKAIAVGGAALAGSAIVSSLKDMVTESLRYTKAMDQMAKVSNSSIEEFQKMAFAASSVGIESEKLGDIFKDVNDKVGEFLQTGGGEMKDFFEQIAPKVGVTAEQFRNLSGPQALQLYVSSLEKAGLNQQEMTFYMEALADEASALIPLMKDNGAAVQAYAAEAQKAGIIITQDLADKSIAAGQKVEFLRTKLEMRWNVAVAENADKIEAIVNKIDRMVSAFFKLIEQMERFGNSPVGKLLAAGGNVASYLNPTNAILAVPDLIESEAARQAKAGRGAAPVAKRALPQSWGKASTAPMLQTGSVYKGGLSQFVGSGMLPSASGTFAGQGAGQGQSIADLAWENANRLEAVQGIIAIRSEETAAKVEVANVQIARSFGDMAQDSINALDRLATAVQGGGALNIISAILGVGLQLGGMGVFGKSVQTNINAPRIPAYAGGTSFHPGGLALVGERGPEIVSMPRGSSVYPNGTGPGGMSVQVLPSKYFDVHVMQGVALGAPSIVEAGAQTAIGRIGKSNARQIGFR